MLFFTLNVMMIIDYTLQHQFDSCVWSFLISVYF